MTNIDRFLFRVWDVKNKEYLTCINDTLRFSCDGIVTIPINQHDKYIIQQCIGLRDKNKILIFEGDILQILGYPKKYITKWHLASYEWVYCDKPGDKNRWSVPWADLHPDAEIIGNIYENPDLLL